jgi:hypothetical protein
MRKFSAFFGTMLFLVLFLSLPNFTKAQEYAGVTGTVTDAQEASIPNVEVNLDNPKTGIHLTTITNDQGFYQFLRLPPGPDYA